MIYKTEFDGKSYIGLYAKSSDRFVIIPPSCSKKFEEAAKKLEVEVIKTFLCSSPYIGLYCVMNSNGILVPSICKEEEIKKLEKLNINIGIIENTKFCAIGNNIVCNDYGALVNPNIPTSIIKTIKQTLNVPVYKQKIGKYNTIGMMISVTNKGFFVSNRATSEQTKEIEEKLKVKGTAGTVNLGLSIVGLGVIANSKNALVGMQTSGFESSRILEGLDLI
jgi:translation initiation factor 6